jgi:hypothetical protein
MSGSDSKGQRRREHRAADQRNLRKRIKLLSDWRVLGTLGQIDGRV